MAAPRAVSTQAVSHAIRALAKNGGRRSELAFSTVAEGIARGATTDPLFPDEPSGAEVSAAFLLAYAWEASRFDTYSREGRFLGLYRIRPPISPPVSSNTLLAPRSATLFALDLMRTSFVKLRGRPLSDRLAWMRDLGRVGGAAVDRAPSAEALHFSRRVVALALQLFAERFSRERSRAYDVSCTLANETSEACA